MSTTYYADYYYNPRDAVSAASVGADLETRFCAGRAIGGACMGLPLWIQAAGRDWGISRKEYNKWYTN